MKKDGNYPINNSIYKDIAKKYYREIFNYCYVKLRYNKQDAEECAQETFMILLIKWKTLSSIDNIRAWLYRTSDNVIRNYNRKTNRHTNELSLFDDAEYDINLKYDDDYYAFELLSALSIEGQQLIKKYYLDKATAKELSNKYQISESAIFVRIHRIKIKLRKILEKENNM